jgi:hypothetical protein
MLSGKENTIIAVASAAKSAQHPAFKKGRIHTRAFGDFFKKK